jgi:NADH dehydrogenase FAD-containing subunit
MTTDESRAQGPEPDDASGRLHEVVVVGGGAGGLELATGLGDRLGRLVSLGKYSTVGNLMGSLVGGNLWIEGYFARVMYVSLYKMHEYALHGAWKVALDTLARMITPRTEPHVKLH